MKLSQLCIGSAAVILVYGNQAHANEGQDLLSDCLSVCQNMSPVVGQQFGYPSYDINAGSTDPYVSPFIIDASKIVTASLACPSGFVCGATIAGFPNLQLEYTDGTSVWYLIAPATMAFDPSSPWNITYGPVESAPLHLFNTQTGLTLKPGSHQLSQIADPFVDPPKPSLDKSQHFLLMSREALTGDPAHVELNQQGEAEQKVYRNIVDVEIAGVATGAVAKLSAQLNAPLNVPDSYALQMRVLTGDGWANFVTDEHNHLAAAKKLESGYCPEAGSDLYQSEFDAGSECLQLTLQDGGPNDGDGAANGSIAVTVGPVLKEIEIVTLQESGSALINKTSNSSTTQGGGGAWSWWMSLVLLVRLGRPKRH